MNTSSCGNATSASFALQSFPFIALRATPLSKPELDHVTRVFDRLFNEFEPPIPSEIAIELDAFECEFSEKYH